MRVVVLGAGYAGVTVVRRLERSLPPDVEIVVVNDSDRHVIQHELHRVIRRPEFADQLTVPLKRIFDRAAVREARVRDIDIEAKEVICDSGELSYDFVAVCLGAQTDYHGLPGVAENAIPLKQVDDALQIRDAFLPVARAGGRAVIGGAGLSGVQVAGEFSEVAAEESSDSPVEIELIEQCDSVTPGFPAAFQSGVRDALRDHGVAVKTNRAIRGVTDSHVEFDGGQLEYDVCVWTGGIRGTDAMSGDRPVVRGTLRYTDGVFVVGDAARVIDRNGSGVPASAQAAIAEARTAATNIDRLVEYERTGGMFEPRLKVCEFEPTGWVVSVGDDAVAMVGPTVITGAPAHALKSSVGAGYLSSVGEVRGAIEYAWREFGPGTKNAS